METAIKEGIEYAEINVSQTGDGVLVYASGRQVYAWTVNDRAAILKCLNLGVDNIIGDDAVYIKTIIGA